MFIGGVFVGMQYLCLVAGRWTSYLQKFQSTSPRQYNVDYYCNDWFYLETACL